MQQTLRSHPAKHWRCWTWNDAGHVSRLHCLRRLKVSADMFSTVDSLRRNDTSDTSSSYKWHTTINNWSK